MDLMYRSVAVRETQSHARCEQVKRTCCESPGGDGPDVQERRRS